MAKVTLSCDVQSNGFSFRLLRHRVLGAAQSVAISEWADAASEPLLPGVSRLLAWVDDEDGATVTDDAILVPHHIIAALDVGAAHSISAPPSPPFLLDLQHLGTIDRPEFRFKATWLQTNGQPVPGVRKEGASLKVGTKIFRIPEPLYGIVEAADAFNAAPPDDMDGRFRAWARMRDLLPEESGKSIQVDGYLGSTRVAHVASFSLALHSGADGFTFDPILFGPDLTTAAAEEHDEMPHEVEGLLPPAQQELFARKRFSESTECSSHYALGAGWYVVLDEPVQKALGVVRKAQMASQEVRKEFVRNPRSFISKALADEFSDEVLETVFLETAEFSERVRDVGIWQPRVLPWIKKSKDSWLPESFGIQVGGQTMALESNQVPVLQAAIESAIAEGKLTVNWNGTDVPATSETLSTLVSLMGEVKPAPGTEPLNGLEEDSVVFDYGPAAGGGQYVLEIDDNLSEVGYQRVRVPRPAVPVKGIPIRLKTSLKAHQEEGLAWLQDAWTSGQPGVLLADDMGLGKTLQALAFLAWLREGMDLGHLKPAPILIVAPTGLLKNWEQEHDQHLHLPGLGDVLRAFGSGLTDIRSHKGREIEIGQATLDAARLSKADWILTTYETLRDYQHSFCSIRYASVVFDEMQKIKVPGTVMTHASKALNTDFIIGLTGTPIENRLADLWCLMDTIQPGLLKDLAAFSRIYEKEENPEDLKQLKAILTEPSPSAPQVMMRRMKADRLKGLPEKIEHPLEQLMSSAQAEAYDEAVKVARAGDGGSKILEALHRLRSISLHPLHPSSAIDDSYVDMSARFKLAVGVLDAIAAKGEKALIFLESQEMQPYLAGFLQRRYKLKSLPMLINGTVTGPKRQDRVNAFQNAGKGFDVIILSPRAGGVGLTLTAANHVIHLSRWWNPAVEDQCTDRCYRIGQTREVHVYYPQALHPAYPDQSFDRRLHALLGRKRQLSREMLMPPTSPDDTKHLFEQTVGSDSSYIFDMDSIDAMEPIQFEQWVLGRLKDVGHKVSKTPKSHDYGADGVVYHRISGRPYIIQCKHTQCSTPPDKAITDLLRAKISYSLKNPGLIAVTNASAFGQAVADKAASEGILLVCRSNLEKWPFLLD